ncbi:sensor histidine kinase inhibitor, KipI family [Algoriphagus hitonicola]|uniref:Sensor histidine kinase inhibitor, KipI family n=1 Tax=Algoriphagus hitonicola TaxID=435880 RepID=A0A1I2XB13_9BACT|nr:5-oxoprolinase subunit PxpB [Algoriphagus hitonicola]SFH10675.1 sensor histidine kinase inhibitor, KipI family [Algoriphagus hitonicola]
MVALIPSIRTISPRLTELFWDVPVSDELLEMKIYILSEISKNFAPSIEDIRSGFKTISIQWKERYGNFGFEEFLANLSLKPTSLDTKTWEIPVCYDLEFGFDLDRLAKLKPITIEEFIHLHSSPTYRIHFIGFLPGFPYLSGLDPKLTTPRKSQPDRAIPSGSVAIGGNQTGIYPQQSPGGWHVIGRTPIRVFNSKASPPVFFEMGDQIKFKPISKEEFEGLKNFNPLQLS